MKKTSKRDLFREERQKGPINYSVSERIRRGNEEIRQGEIRIIRTRIALLVGLLAAGAVAVVAGLRESGFSSSLIGESCVSAGECGAGMFERKWGFLQVQCSSMENAVAEICDGLDNDCDGDVDGEFGVGRACIEGIIECVSPTEARCSTDAGGSDN